MLHFYLTLNITAVALFLLSQRFGLRKAFIFLSWMPMALLIFSLTYEGLAGEKSWLDAVLKLAFGSSIILAACGIILTIKAYLGRDGFLNLFVATILVSVLCIPAIVGFVKWLRIAMY